MYFLFVLENEIIKILPVASPVCWEWEWFSSIYMNKLSSDTMSMYNFATLISKIFERLPKRETNRAAFCVMHQMSIKPYFPSMQPK